MKRSKQYLKVLCILGGILTSSVTYAECLSNECESAVCDSNCWNPCDLSFSLGVEAVYAKYTAFYDMGNTSPTVDGNDITSDPIEYVYKDLCPDWDWGYRLTAETYSSDRLVGLQARYTSLSTSSSGTLRSSEVGAKEVWPGLNSVSYQNPNTNKAEQTTSHADWDIHQLDVVLGFNCCYCGIQWQPYAGYRGIYLKRHVSEINSDSTGENFATLANGGDKSYSKSKATAYGFVFGTELSREFCECLNAFARVGVNYLGYDYSNKIVGVSTGSEGEDNNFNYKNNVCRNLSTLNGAVEGAVGLEYNRCICSYSTHFGLSYEFTQYPYYGDNFYYYSGEGESLSAVHFSAAVDF